MKVMFLYPRRFNPNQLNGGVEEFLKFMVDELAKLNIESVIYAGDKRVTEIQQPIKMNEKAIVINGPFPRPKFFLRKKTYQPIIDLCKQLHIDVMHAQGTYIAGFLAFKLFQSSNIPYVVTSHSDILETNSKRMKRHSVKNRCKKQLKYATQVTHLTTYMMNASNALFDTTNKNVIIPNGIKPNLYANKETHDYLFAMGRLVKGKGFHILIDVYHDLISQGVETPLVIAGRGEEENALQTQAKNLGLNVVIQPPSNDLSIFPKKSIIFIGHIQNEIKIRLMASCKCFLFATQPELWDEAFGIVQLEAMAAGVPMVASDTPPTRYLEKQGMRAFIVKPNDKNEWTKSIKVLLEDNDLRAQFGKENILASHQFDWSLIAKAYADVYQQSIIKPLSNVANVNKNNAKHETK